MPYFYSTNRVDNHILFDPVESKHIVKTLRKRLDDEIIVTDGQGHIFTCRIINEDFRRLSAEIIAEWTHPIHKPINYVAISLLKKMQRWEFMLEKLVELGIQHIIPITAQRTEKQTVRQDRLEKIAISALKQCEGKYLPTIHPVTMFDQLITMNHSEQKVIPSLLVDHSNRILDSMQPDKSTTVLIGPEGGFTENELALAIENGFVGVSLGKKVLRTETAAIYVSGLLHAINQW